MSARAESGGRSEGPSRRQDGHIGESGRMPGDAGELPLGCTLECSYPWRWYLAFGILLGVGAWMLIDYFSHPGLHELGESMAFGLVILVIAGSAGAFLWSPSKLRVDNESVIGIFLLRKSRSWARGELGLEERRGFLFAVIGGHAVKNREGRTQFLLWPGLTNLKLLGEHLKSVRDR